MDGGMLLLPEFFLAAPHILKGTCEAFHFPCAPSSAAFSNFVVP